MGDEREWKYLAQAFATNLALLEIFALINVVYKFARKRLSVVLMLIIVILKNFIPVAEAYLKENGTLDDFTAIVPRLLMSTSIFFISRVV